MSSLQAALMERQELVRHVRTQPLYIYIAPSELWLFIGPVNGRAEKIGG